jgi:diguanylate cyclase (GGDEF)-like protein
MVPSPPRSGAILLVEDGPVDAAVVEAMLPGHAVTRAVTAGAACDALQAAAFDCVLLDLELPDASGLEALERVQLAAPAAAVVVLTGTDDEELGAEAMRQGAQDYLVKGASADTLHRAIRYAVERKHAEWRMAQLALSDPLTGLPNRTLFMDRLAQALARRERDGGEVAVLFLDLDRFKVVNDSLGHEAGDALLRAVAARLSAVLRPGDTLARLGGDEFAGLCSDLPEATGTVEVVAARLLDALAEPIAVDGHRIVAGASIGIAVTTGGEATAIGLLRDADTAMYRAKHHGGGVELFDARLREEALRRFSVEHELRRGLAAGELVLHFQPQVAVADPGRVVGAEALVRWRHPQRGLLAPADFVPVAEASGLIEDVGTWVLHEAVRRLRAWMEAGRVDDDFVMSVNVSGRQLRAAGFPATVRAALADGAVAPSSVCLEITETAALGTDDEVVRRLDELKAVGVRLALDDFGTGFASLTWVERFPIDVLKVDRSLVAGVAAAGPKRDVVAAVLTLARALGLTAVAEGVEGDGDLLALRQLGCGVAQGFAFGRPVPGPPARRRFLPRGGDRPVRVFLCDDGPDIRFLLRAAMGHEGDFAVVGESSDGRGLSAAVREAGANVVVVDLAMPEVGGLQAIRALRRDLPGVGVVVYSGFAAEEMAERVRALGVEHYIEKGSPIAGLMDAVRGSAGASPARQVV